MYKIHVYCGDEVEKYITNFQKREQDKIGKYKHFLTPYIPTH